MNDSPFRRIVLPALLASSAGFAALTWPMASDHAVQVSDQLPAPLSRWVDSALMPNQHKEFSIRYIGFAILSSVAIGIGTAEAMRSRQGRSQRRQNLLDQALDAAEDRPLVDSMNIDHASAAARVEVTAVDHPTSTLDWSSLLQTSAENDSDEPASEPVGLLSTAIGAHTLYHIQGVNQQRCLALAVEGEYYRYYRNRPNLEKARGLVQQLQRQGKKSIATQDDSGYVVWVHESEPPQQAMPWPDLLTAR